MSGPLLPSDLQFDVGMSVEEVNSLIASKINNDPYINNIILKNADPSEIGISRGYSSTVASDYHWSQPSTISSDISTTLLSAPTIPIDYNNDDSSPNELQIPLFSEHSSPGHPSSFLSNSSSSGFDELRTPCRFSDQPDHCERSEASLTSAIAAISYMANHASSTSTSPFPSLEGLSTVHPELDSGEKTIVTESRNKGGAVIQSRIHPILQTEKAPRFSGASETTSPTHDLDFNTLLRVLSLCRGRLSHPTLKGIDNQSNSDGTIDYSNIQTPCQSQVPLFGNRYAVNLVADLPNRLIGCSSEIALVSAEQREFASVETAPYPTATSCTDLGRRSGEDLLEDDEGSDTIEPLDLFLQHTLGSTRKRFQITKHETHFHSPSSGTFLNKSYYGGDSDAQDALKRLLDCFSTMQQQESSFGSSASIAAATALKDRYRQLISENNSNGEAITQSEGALTTCQIHLSDSDYRTPESIKYDYVSQQPPSLPSLYSSPVGGGTSINSQESLSPRGRGSHVMNEKVSSNHQGAATAPAAMMRDAEAMLASLLTSLGNQTDQDEEISNNLNVNTPNQTTRDDGKGSISSRHDDVESPQYNTNHRSRTDKLDNLKQQLNQSSTENDSLIVKRENNWHHLSSPLHQPQLQSNPHLLPPSDPSQSYNRSRALNGWKGTQRCINGNIEARNGISWFCSSSELKESMDHQKNKSLCINPQDNIEIDQQSYIDNRYLYERRNYDAINGIKGLYYPRSHHEHKIKSHDDEVIYHNQDVEKRQFQEQSIEEFRRLHYFDNSDIAQQASYFHSRDSRDGCKYLHQRHGMISNLNIKGNASNDHPLFMHHLPRMMSPGPLYHDSFNLQQHYYSASEVDHRHQSYTESHCLNEGFYNHHHLQLIVGNVPQSPTDEPKVMKRIYSDDRDRMVYVSWIPKKARAYNTIDKRKMELDLKRKLREDLILMGLTKVLLFPPKGVHCKLIFDSRPSAANFMNIYGGENRSDETERWKVDLCRIYGIDMHDKFDKTVVKIEWAQK